MSSIAIAQKNTQALSAAANAISFGGRTGPKKLQAALAGINTSNLPQWAVAATHAFKALLERTAGHSCPELCEDVAVYAMYVPELLQGEPGEAAEYAHTLSLIIPKIEAADYAGAINDLEIALYGDEVDLEDEEISEVFGVNAVSFLLGQAHNLSSDPKLQAQVASAASAIANQICDASRFH